MTQTEHKPEQVLHNQESKWRSIQSILVFTPGCFPPGDKRDQVGCQGVNSFHNVLCDENLFTFFPLLVVITFQRERERLEGSKEGWSVGQWTNWPCVCGRVKESADTHLYLSRSLYFHFQTILNVQLVFLVFCCCCCCCLQQCFFYMNKYIPMS